MKNDDLADFLDRVHFRTSDSILEFSQPIIREQDQNTVRFYKLTQKEFYLHPMVTTHIHHVAIYNPANTQWRKREPVFNRFGKLNVVGSERMYLKYDCTANNIHGLRIPYTPIAVMFDKNVEEINDWRLIEWKSTEFEIHNDVNQMIIDSPDIGEARRLKRKEEREKAMAAQAAK